MGITRSQAQWKTTIKEQQKNGLTIIDHYMSIAQVIIFFKKSALTSNNVVRAKVAQQVELVSSQTVIELSIGLAKITLPSLTNTSYLGQVLRELTKKSLLAYISTYNFC
ncbi:MAG: IS66 family insertion sequence element accessory protein TnpB [Litorilituus sp.]|nr:IS66 family insertion sequence element accessory protein TnpB [Litorilituus sp.]